MLSDGKVMICGGIYPHEHNVKLSRFLIALALISQQNPLGTCWWVGCLQRIYSSFY